MSGRQVVVHRGRHLGWWVEGRKANGRLFMKTWWPAEGLARAVARLVGGETDRNATSPGIERKPPEHGGAGTQPGA